jgi:hypothetical protein
LKVEAEQQAEAEAHEKARMAAEEKQRAEELRQAEESARAEREEREKARIAAEEKVRRQVEVKTVEEKTAIESIVEATPQASKAMTTEAQAPQDVAQPTATEESEPRLVENDQLPKAWEFSVPRPSPKKQTRIKREQAPESTPRENFTSPIRLQLLTKRETVTLNLVPCRRDGMPNNLEVTTTTKGVLQLSEWREDAYQPIPLSDFPASLSDGLVWQAPGDGRRWRWELTRRELYVLAAGDEFGLHGFVTRRNDQRLWLNTKHVILAKENLRDQVIAALAEAGCQSPEVCDATMPGVPSGWILIRDVIPTRSVQMRGDRDPLNVLCPAHEIEPQFVGGIRLERNVWLAGYAPRIRFNGEPEDDFEVLIDDQRALLASDGAFEAPGWDNEGEHRLWFGGKAVTYALHTMQEEWDPWHAHDPGTGTAICGAGIHRVDGSRCRQVRVPVSNPLLLGSRPGDIFYCQQRNDVRSETILAQVPFTPVWALPLDAAHADKRSARLLSLESLEPATIAEHSKHKHQMSDEVSRWVAAINDAARKQLKLSADNEAAKALWRRYRAIAKQLWKQGRKRR